ncbi:hypothetical protein BGM26_21270 [Bacillus sp. FJAT-29790]|uniref:hypothetical protein n=1 Tax=Bacillus sp. FJAT-29790 TaxID=1895002 RepID=UPI001C2329B0|nr:hypothetical protein [Bacillus sp. FJAT-29790]MBU8881453.1 hypothetical protein [Bacillus sp. FJAT-29790]
MTGTPFCCLFTLGKGNYSDYFKFIQQKSLNDIIGEMNANRYPIPWGFKPWLNKAKPTADAQDLLKEFIEQAKVKIWAQIRQGEFEI